MSREGMLGRLPLALYGLSNDRLKDVSDLVKLLDGENGPAWAAHLRKICEAGLPDQPENASSAPFVISGYGDGRTPVQLMQAGRFDTIWDGARSFVSGKHFPSTTGDTADVEFEYVEFDHDPTSEEVLAEFARRGLERPTAEDALRFAERYPDEQRSAPVVFLHEPWRSAFDSRHVLYLSSWNGLRNLRDDRFDSRWRRQCRFPARRPRK